jgi:hypothetical protein
MPFTVRQITPTEFHVINHLGKKVAESPTQHEAEATARLNNDIEQGKEIPEPKQVPV